MTAPTPSQIARVLRGCADDIDEYYDDRGLVSLVTDRLRRYANEFEPENDEAPAS